MNEIELKPCPFCGATANFFTKLFRNRGTSRGWEFGICCTKCDITLPKSDYRLEVQFGNLGGITTVIDERPLAVEAWNRRADNE